MLLGGLFSKALGATILLSFYLAMVLFAFISSSSHSPPTSLTPSLSPSLHRAYVTLLTDESHLPALLTLSHTLRLSSSTLPLVVLLPSSFAHHHLDLHRLLSSLPSLHPLYLKPSPLPPALSVDGPHAERFLLLSAFSLTQYRRLLYLPVHSLLHSSLDALLTDPLPLTFSIAAPLRYTPDLCLAFSSPSSPPASPSLSYADLLALEAAPQAKALDHLPRHLLPSSTDVPFTLSPLLLAPSTALAQRLRDVLDGVDTPYRGADCRCDEPVDVLHAMFHHQCTRGEMERQAQVEGSGGASRGLHGPLFYPHEMCWHRLPLNASLAHLTSACGDQPAFWEEAAVTQLDCEDDLQLLPTVLQDSVIDQLMQVERLTLVADDAQDASDVERQKAEAHRRKYADEFLVEQEQEALARLRRLMEGKMGQHEGGKKGAMGKVLGRCERTYEQWLHRYFEAVGAVRLKPLKPAHGQQ